MATNHKPLVKLFGDRTLDEISNTRLFRLKQRALPWKFKIQYVPGKQNPFADATSRHPSQADSEDDDEEPASVIEILAGLRILEMMTEKTDNTMEIASAMLDLKKAQTDKWD